MTIVMTQAVGRSAKGSLLELTMQHSHAGRTVTPMMPLFPAGMYGAMVIVMVPHAGKLVQKILMMLPLLCLTLLMISSCDKDFEYFNILTFRYL